MTSTVGSEKYQATVNKNAAVKARQRRRQAEQLAAKARLGCDYCLKSKADIQGEPARMKAETMARHPEWFA